MVPKPLDNLKEKRVNGKKTAACKWTTEWRSVHLGEEKLSRRRTPEMKPNLSQGRVTPWCCAETEKELTKDQRLGMGSSPTNRGKT